MKTQKENRLNFTKRNVVELNEGQLLDIDGGTTPVCVMFATSSVGCVGVLVGAVGLGYMIGADKK